MALSASGSGRGTVPVLDTDSAAFGDNAEQPYLPTSIEGTTVPEEFAVNDLVELRTESKFNRSLFRIKDIDGPEITLGQLSDRTGEYIGVDTLLNIDDPEDADELMRARPEVVAEYPHA